MPETRTEAQDTRDLAEAESLRSLAERNLAEARLFTLQALKATYDADSAKLALKEKKRAEKKRRRTDEQNYVYKFRSGVTASTVEACAATLTEWHRRDPDSAWTIIFNSPGGSVIDGNELLGYLKDYGLRWRLGGTHHITTVVRGYAASMGGVLLQAGDERVCGAESYILIHELSAGTGGTIGQIEDQVEFYKKICADYVELFVERSEGKISKPLFVKNWRRTDWWLGAKDSLKYGFIDRIG